MGRIMLVSVCSELHVIPLTVDVARSTGQFFALEAPLPSFQPHLLSRKITQYSTHFYQRRLPHTVTRCADSGLITLRPAAARAEEAGATSKMPSLMERLKADAQAAPLRPTFCSYGGCALPSDLR